MPSVVYFIRCGDSIKIGTTSDLTHRLDVIARKRRPLTCDLLGAIVGGRLLEQSMHRELSSFRETGEWFHADDLVLRVIDDLLRKRRGLRGDDAFSLTHGERVLTEDASNERKYIGLCQAALDTLVQYKQRQGYAKEVCLRLISEDLGVPKGTIWALCYRPTRSVPAGLYASITVAAARLAGESAAALSDAGPEGRR